jgi:hypothetical protein
MRVDVHALVVAPERARLEIGMRHGESWKSATASGD